MQLCEDTPDSPHVHGFEVLSVPTKQLRRSIPPSSNVVRVLLLFITAIAREPKVAKLNHPGLTYQQVFWLDVSMHDFLTV